MTADEAAGSCDDDQVVLLHDKVLHESLDGAALGTGPAPRCTISMPGPAESRSNIRQQSMIVRAAGRSSSLARAPSNSGHAVVRTMTSAAPTASARSAANV